MLSDSVHYEAFAAVVENGSISAAARVLGWPRATLSRRLAQLETDLGVQLLHRTTRAVLATPSGERLYERVRPLLDELRAAEQALLDEAAEPRGLLRVSAPPLIAASAGALCAELNGLYPKLTVELVTSLRFVDLHAEGFEVVLRAGQLNDPELICRRLLTTRVAAAAAPEYLGKALPLNNLDDLARHALLLGHTADGRARRWWPTLAGGRVRVDGRFITNDRQLLKVMAVQGRGIALLSEHNCADAIATGRLRWVLPELLGTSLALFVVYARRTVLPPRVRVFVDAAVAHFADLGRPALA